MPAGALLVTADGDLAALVRRLAALAGTGCDVARESAMVRAAWRQSGLVLVGGDLVAAVAAADLPPRDRVMVVTDAMPDAACWSAALAIGARRVLTLPGDQAALVEELRVGDRPDVPNGRAIGVVGGCGGAGASTFACALALTAAKDGPTVLVDGDRLGGGIDVLLGAEGTEGLRWGDLAGTRGRLDPAALADALCQVAGIAVLPWGMARDRSGNRSPAAVSGEAVGATLQAAARAFATLVVDLPRYGGPIAEVLCDAVDAAVLVVPAEVRGVAAAAGVIAAWGSRLPNPHLVVREAGAGLSARDVAASLGLELVACYRDDPAVRAAGQRGELPLRRGRGPLAAACEATLGLLVSPVMSR